MQKIIVRFVIGNSIKARYLDNWLTASSWKVNGTQARKARATNDREVCPSARMVQRETQETHNTQLRVKKK